MQVQNQPEPSKLDLDTLYVGNCTRFPDALENLTFGLLFNQSLVGVAWPSNLQRLIFGDAFNQSMAGVTLPNNLQILTFGDAFTQSLDKSHLL